VELEGEIPDLLGVGGLDGEQEVKSSPQLFPIRIIRQGNIKPS